MARVVLYSNDIGNRSINIYHYSKHKSHIIRSNWNEEIVTKLNVIFFDKETRMS